VENVKREKLPEEINVSEKYEKKETADSRL